MINLVGRRLTFFSINDGLHDKLMLFPSLVIKCIPKAHGGRSLAATTLDDLSARNLKPQKGTDKTFNFFRKVTGKNGLCMVTSCNIKSRCNQNT